MDKLERKIAYDRNAVIDIAIDFLNNRDKYVILDTETTGLGDNDVIIQVGMLDLDGNVLLDTLIKPTKRKRISGEATAIHGITMKMLTDAPTFKEIIPKISQITGNKKMLIYNGQYEARLFSQTAIQDDFVFKPFDSYCIMIMYSMFVGDWSDYHQSYTFQKLPGGDHTAIGDCKATLNLINKMAKAQKVELPPKKWWQIF